jgi:molybdate transport system regulatory protein
MGMSYKKAWSMVNEMNKRGHAPYVVPKTGGEKGGGAEPTRAGEDLVKAYQKVVGRIMKIINNEKSLLDLI